MIKKIKEKGSRKKIFIILGPTSSGKTSLALDLCRKFNGEIISTDSRQVIKHMDIGTGKVPFDKDGKIDVSIEKKYKDGCWVIDGINVWGYDLAEPSEFFSGYGFADFALKKSRELIENGKNVFLVGGTGFYIDLFTGVIKPSNVIPDLELRDSLESLSLEELQKKLKVLNQAAFNKIDQKNKVRLIRAIEKCLSKEINEKELPYLKDTDFIFIGLKASREFLYKRCDLWVESIWRNGIIEEVKRLCDLGYENSPKLRGLVYKTVLGYTKGEIGEGEKGIVERIKFDIHGYVRRQQTWFKKKQDILWVDVSQDGFREIIYNIVKENI